MSIRIHYAGTQNDQNDQRASWPSYQLHNDDFIRTHCQATHCFVTQLIDLSAEKVNHVLHTTNNLNYNHTTGKLTRSSHVSADLNDRLLSSFVLFHIDTIWGREVLFLFEQTFVRICFLYKISGQYRFCDWSLSWFTLHPILLYYGCSLIRL